MELKIDVKYEQILKLAQQLPYKYKKKLSKEIEKELKEKIQKKVNVVDKKNESDTSNDKEYLNELQQFLLQGPVMSDKQFEEFRELRKDFDKWLSR